MRIVDRYLLRHYLKTFFICWVSFTGLYVVVDAFSNLDEFMAYAEVADKKLLEVLGTFYLYRSASFFDRFSAVLAMIAAMFTMTAVQRHNELTALMAAGISRLRAARPVIAAAITITLFATVGRELVIPDLRAELSTEPRELAGDTVVELQPRVDVETGIIFHGKYMQPKQQSIHRPNFLLPPGLDAYGKHLEAVDAFYEPPRPGRIGGYRFKGVTSPTEIVKQPSLGIGERAVLLTPVEYGDWLGADECFIASNIDFQQLSAGKRWRQYLSTAELIAGLRNPSLDFGADTRVAIHARFTQPFLDVVLLFLGLPLVMRRETKNIYVAVGLCAVATVSLMVVVMTCHYLGTIVYMRAATAAWLPLLIFVPIAVALYDRIDR